MPTYSSPKILITAQQDNQSAPHKYELSTDIAACQLAIPFMDESHDEGILIGGDEIDPLRVDRTGTADDGVYVGSTIVIATMKPLEQVPRTSP